MFSSSAAALVCCAFWWFCFCLDFSFVLSLPAVVKLVEAADGGVCGCQADDSPDDMFLGMCLQSLHIPIAHRPEFHQVGSAGVNLLRIIYHLLELAF